MRRFAGRPTEDTTTADDLAAELRKRDVGAQTLPVFSIREAGRIRVSKPDIEVTDGGVHIGSAKVGEHRTFDAYRSATAYKAEIPLAVEMQGKQLGEVFAVTYPTKRDESYHLYVLPREGRHREISLTLESLSEVADSVVDAIRGKFDTLALRAEPTVNVATRILYYGALELADAIREVREKELEAVFGGHDFFISVLASSLKGDERKEALRMGPAFLFVNQVLFYVLLSDADRATGNKEFPQIRTKDASNPATLQRQYFDRVRRKNYEPIYGIDVARLFAGKRAEAASKDIVTAIQDLAPSLESPDLAGQVFQTLIPLDTRKPLAAYYTNPKAAALLAGLAIENPDVTVLDPCCGSGTLLVAAYRRKAELIARSGATRFHRRFVEHEITGLDAMAFSAHLAAVNLALQSPLQDTEHVRIATCDSTRKRPGDLVVPTQESLPSELRQATLLEEYGVDAPKKKTKGPVRMRGSQTGSFRLEHVDLVIMNPPFTSWDNMAPDYRSGLVQLFSNERSAYKDALYWKTSQQAFFLLLADRFLKPGGRVAAVLPLTTFTGRAFEPLLKFLLSNYTIRYIVVGLGRCSFSEETSLTECLFIADKTPPPTEDSSFPLIGASKPPEAWTDFEVQSMIETCKKADTSQQLCTIASFPQNSLRLDRETLSGLLLRLIPEFRQALQSAEEIKERSSVPIISVSTFFERGGVQTSRWVLGGGWLRLYAPKALFAYRSAGRAIRDVDRLVVQTDEDGFLEVKDKEDGPSTRLRKAELVPALRRITHLPRFDVSEITDYCVYKAGSSVKQTVVRYYGATDGERRWKRVTKGTAVGTWEDLVRKGMCNLAVAGRLDVAAPGTRFICCRSAEPFLLAAYGFMVKGFKTSLEEKLFCLWLNSSFALLSLLEKATITRGTWLRLEQFLLRQISIPDCEKLSPKQREEVEKMYNLFGREEWPPLVEQMKASDGPRARLDEALLSLLGFPSADSTRIGHTVRGGILRAIGILQKTMEHKMPENKQGLNE